MNIVCNHQIKGAYEYVEIRETLSKLMAGSDEPI